MRGQYTANFIDRCGQRVAELLLLKMDAHFINGVLPELIDTPLVDRHITNNSKFLRSLRKMPQGDRPKVVFCTTENDVAHIARALHAGANEYIMKPFDKEIVEAKFQEVGLI